MGQEAGGPRGTCYSLPFSFVPLQLSLLTNLYTLKLYGDRNERQNLGVLSTLSSLRSLNLTDARELPACLPVMTQLEELAVYCEGALSADDAIFLGATLEQLQQFTCLALFSTSLAGIPAAVTGMERLRRFLFWNGPLDAALPVGPWLGGLRWLGLTWPAAHSGLRALKAAVQLEPLVVTGQPDRRSGDDANSWIAFWDFVQHHALLRYLTFHFTGAWQGSRALVDAMLGMARRRPALLIQRTDSTFCNQLTDLEGTLPFDVRGMQSLLLHSGFIFSFVSTLCNLPSRRTPLHSDFQLLINAHWSASSGWAHRAYKQKTGNIMRRCRHRCCRAPPPTAPRRPPGTLPRARCRPAPVAAGCCRLPACRTHPPAPRAAAPCSWHERVSCEQVQVCCQRPVAGK